MPHALTWILKAETPEDLKEVQKHGMIDSKIWRAEYQYWVIEESYREGKKVKSRVLFNFGHRFDKKPSKLAIRRLIKEIEKDWYRWMEIAQQETTTEHKRWEEKARKDLLRLEYAFSRLS